MEGVRYTRDFDGLYIVERDGAQFIRRDEAERHLAALEHAELYREEGGES